MASDRARRRDGGFVVVAGGGMVAAGVIIDQAWTHGFWGTFAVAALAAAWLAALTWWTAMCPRDAPPEVAASDSEDDRLMLRVLLDQAPGALLAIEDGGRIRALNRAARTLFATDDLVLPPPTALLLNDTLRLHHGGRSWRIDRVTVDGGGLQRTVAALVDVEAEEHAAEARATRELLRVLGHEVMNAMAPITSLAESALGVLNVPERRDRLLPEILGTLGRRADGLRRFTEVYRQVARLPAPTLAMVRLADLLADLKRLFESEWQGRAMLEVADHPDDAVASLDRDQIVQALLAILRNAAEAGTVVMVPAVVYLSVDYQPHRLTFRVVDGGSGIDPVHAASIFLPFFTTKPDGSGIGLTAARQIAQGHGGDIALSRHTPTMVELSIPR